MKLAALFSGGKDSTFSIFKAKTEGHDIVCLLTIIPTSADSMLFHFPNAKFTKLQSQAMKLPQILSNSKSTNPESESETLKKILLNAKKEYGITGLVHGGILSEFQKQRFNKISNDLDIKLISPIWGKNQNLYMKNLLDSKFKFIIISVSCDGLDESWLGKEITYNDLEKLKMLSKKYGFNLNFEGGEAETFVIDCPLFSNSIKIKDSKIKWDGYRGIFEIVKVDLE